MTPVVTEEDRTELERLDDRIGKWAHAVQDEAKSIDLEHAKRWAETARRWAVKLQATPPPALDERALAKIRKIILEGLDAQRNLDLPLDVLDDLIVRAEAIRHVLRDLLDADVGVDETDARALVLRLHEWLPRITQAEIAELASMSTRQIQRWAKDGGTAPHRLVLVARLIALLRRGWTPEGVVAWFKRPRADLEGESPLDVLGDPAYEQDLLEAARRGRAQQG